MTSHDLYAIAYAVWSVLLLVVVPVGLGLVGRVTV